MIAGKYKLDVLDQRPAVMMGREEWLHSSHQKAERERQEMVLVKLSWVNTKRRKTKGKLRYRREIMNHHAQSVSISYKKKLLQKNEKAIISQSTLQVILDHFSFLVLKPLKTLWKEIVILVWFWILACFNVNTNFLSKCKIHLGAINNNLKGFAK